MAPVAVLAFLAVVAGFALSNWIVDWLAPVTGYEPADPPIPPLAISGIVLVLVIIGAGLAWVMYDRRPVPTTAPAGNWLTRAARVDLYGHAVYEAVFMRPGQYLTRFLVWFDNRVVDGAVNGLAATIGGLSGRARRLQTGFARSYALSMLGGTAVVALTLVLVRL